jgi:ParB family transcriptional regulator, chromosome partitioning protein
MRQALGKGIGALIPAASRPSEPPPPTGVPAGSIRSLPVSSIDTNPRQPRTHFDEDSLADLVRSVAERGVIQPILVRALGNGRFELIAGERRLRAARQAGLSEIPALVKEASDDESLVLAIVENVQRADLGPLEEAHAYRALIEEFSLRQEDVARRVGKSRPAIANSLRLLQLPQSVQAELAAGRLSAGHARALLSLDSDRARETLAREIVQRQLSVRDAEKAAGAAQAKAKPKAAATHDADVRRLESELSRALGTKVSIHPGKSGAGHLQIDYFSDSDLSRVADLLIAAGRRPAHRTARA